ncbi:MAG TPA: ribokinase [Anaerohalosphaeraceae bacterium]|nr:ribokinase [Anaerohalosphaeraceae bacterium]HRT51999.1 ribokinase [Anaerohalosphaeraceae bacterium]HRT88062.1 ribokinase [Anaerohalosphaeraceae bacterium]
MTRRIVVIGSSNTDMIIKIDHIPRPGETVIGGTFSTAAGGKGANQAVAAARAGGRVTFIARVGDDMFGRQALDGFRADGIDVSHVIIDPDAPSGVASIFVDAKGQNSIAVAGGANANLSPDDIHNAADVIAAADILVMQLETPVETVRAAAQIARDNAVTVILNPAPAQPLDKDLLKCISILTPNESEAELLTGIPVDSPQAAQKAADALRAQGVNVVIVTMGENGALLSTQNASAFVPAFKVDAVDATAAGDVFNGALAVAVAEGAPLPRAVRFASAAAALSVTKLGAQPSAPTRAVIEHMI